MQRRNKKKMSLTHEFWPFQNHIPMLAKCQLAFRSHSLDLNVNRFRKAPVSFMVPFPPDEEQLTVLITT